MMTDSKLTVDYKLMTDFIDYLLTYKLMMNDFKLMTD